jgi:hypothetical protein
VSPQTIGVMDEFARAFDRAVRERIDRWVGGDQGHNCPVTVWGTRSRSIVQALSITTFSMPQP